MMFLRGKYLLAISFLVLAFAAPATASQRYINEAEGYSAIPPPSWQIAGPGQHKEISFRRDGACHMVIFPAGRRNQMSPRAYINVWEPKTLKPGTAVERRTQLSEMTINDYPSILTQYMGKNGPLEIVFMRLPHQILLVLLECPASREQVMNLFGDMVGSIRALGKTAPSLKPSPQPQTPNPTPQSAQETTKNRPQIYDTSPGFKWE